MRSLILQMIGSVAINGIFGLNGYIMVKKGIFWTIEEHLYFCLLYFYILSKDIIL